MSGQAKHFYEFGPFRLEEQRYIKTIPRRGYRFVADVREVTDGELDLLVRETSQSRIVIEEEIEPPKVIEVAPAAFRPQPAPALRESKKARPTRCAPIHVSLSCCVA